MAFLTSLGQHAIAFVLVLTVIVFVHEWGHYIVARLNGVKIDVFSIGFGPELFGWFDRAGTRWKVSAIPLGGYVKFFGDADAASSGPEERPLAPEEAKFAFVTQALWRRAAIVFAGPASNFVFAIVVYAALFAAAGRPFTPPVVGKVLPGSAAAQAGFVAKDRILSIGGVAVHGFEDIRNVVTVHAGVPLPVVVRRDGRITDFTVTPRKVTVADGFGGTQSIGEIGILAADRTEYVKLSPVAALEGGIAQTWGVTATTMTYLGGVLSGRQSGRQLGGPLRIAEVSGAVIKLGFAALAALIATLSISIGLINLFPIPLLDGGHLLFYALEALRGRPLGERAQEYGFRLGLILVLGIFVFATWNDLVQLRVVSFLTRVFS